MPQPSPPAPAPTHYELLDIAASATPAEVTSAYRRAARRLHPDLNPDADADALSAISAAYAVLSRPDRRAAYDEALAAAGPPVTSQDGLDVTTTLAVTSAQAAEGTQVPLEVPVSQPCRTCAGTGCDAQAPARTCPSCDGLMMHLRTGEPCAFCAGRGSISDVPCGSCGGARAVAVVVPVVVRVPPGTVTGTVLRLARRGAASADGRTRGDLRVHVRVSGPPSPPPSDPSWAGGDEASPSNRPPGPGPVPRLVGGSDFQVAANGADLGLVARVSYVDLRLGADLEVAGPDGRRWTATVPAGSVPGDVVVIAGAGLPHPDGSTAALHLQLQLDVPRTVAGPAERAALEGLRIALDSPA